MPNSKHYDLIVCANNLKQLGMALQHYGVDNKLWIPHMSIQQHGYPFIGEWFLYYREGYLGIDTLTAPASGITLLAASTLSYSRSESDVGHDCCARQGSQVAPSICAHESARRCRRRIYQSLRS